ncbi:MAG: HNH endonuclease signature motif containing protein [Clostridia bacterium]|nr:HNH endonuclease signature motif containing protein [Clostridia bacterium]
MGKERNLYISKEKHSELHILDKYKKTKAIVLIDSEDVDKLKEYCFRMHNKGYISTSIKGKTKYLHQIVYGKIEEGFEIDHINRNKLDNRKCNLRKCKHIDNAHNRIKKNKFNQQGITKLKRLKTRPYHVRVANKHIGYYATIEEAVQARVKAEKEMYKDFATV